MVVLSYVFHLSLILFVAWRCWKNETTLRKVFWPALTLRMAAGVCLGLLYIYYYSTADTFAYFDDASKLAGLARTDFGAWIDAVFAARVPDSIHLTLYQPRALFLTRITSVFSLVTGDQYWIIGAYFSAFSFAGAWYLVKTIARYIPSATPAAIVAFLFLPSVVFWTSGVLKESLAVAALYYLAAFFLRLWSGEKPNVARLSLAALSLWLLWNLKYYYAAIFIPVLLATVLYRLLFSGMRLRAVAEAVAWVACLVIPAIAITFLHPNFHADRLMHVIVMNNAAYNAMSDPNGVVHFHNLRPVAASLMENAPWALFSGLFRPLPWEAGDVMPLLAALENTAVIILFVFALPQLKKYVSSEWRLLILALTVYVIVLCVLLTFSAPNFGTMSRYRVGYFSFFVFILLSGVTIPLRQSWHRRLDRL